ncbi:hypothetical protein J0X19_24670 [Hymenobacter sp. BT186]|uniref:Uncharacterized protein n=1 Tax=Hymenobacter telluris TaxID=2816474 RepID=A0A939F324_9BACT|nr:hypothetical protein [Hymenobacter telluris]MBO0361175.1 hypothetical protein [Hymenobacter telluris]MBW3377203.1 hypothetical protein [Hymenobacter norwichensis]
MKKPKLTGSRPLVPIPAAAPSIDAHLFGTPVPAPARFPTTADTTTAEGEAVTRVIFTNQLKPDVYVMLRQYEHHAEAELQEILDAALRAYLTDKPQAHQPLPPKAAAKLRDKLRKK